MKTLTANKSAFELGAIFITDFARQVLTQSEITRALARHANGDWGKLCDDDVQQNELGLEQGLRIFSAYGNGKRRFWIITEGDRSSTTIMLPSDY